MITIERFKNASMVNKESHIKTITLCQDNGVVVSKTLFFDAIDKYIETKDQVFLSLAKSLTRTRAINWGLMNEFIEKWTKQEKLHAIIVVDNLIKESDFQFMKNSVINSLLKQNMEIPIQLGFVGDDDKNIRIESTQKLNTQTNETHWIGEPACSKIFLSVDEFLDMNYKGLIDLYYEL